MSICCKKHTYNETSSCISQKGNSWSTMAPNPNQTKVQMVALQFFFLPKWPKAGKGEEASPQTIRGGEAAGETTRLLSVIIEIKTVVSAKTKSKFKHLRLTLMTSYHPISRYLDKNTSNFNQQMSTMLNLISKEIILILGADLNAFIRTWQTHSTVNNDANDPSESLFGPHGNLRKNTWGELIIGVLNQNQLRAASTFFESNNKHDTWTYPASKEKYQLDHFLIKWNNLQFVMNVKQKSNGVPSDAALMISLRFPNTKWLLKKHHDRTARKVFKINNKILHNTKQSLQIKNYQVHQLNQLQSNKRHVQSITLRSPIKVWNTHHKIGKRKLKKK